MGRPSAHRGVPVLTSTPPSHSECQEWLPRGFSHLEEAVEAWQEANKRLGQEPGHLGIHSGFPLQEKMCPHLLLWTSWPFHTVRCQNPPGLCLLTTGEDARVVSGWPVARRPIATLPPLGVSTFQERLSLPALAATLRPSASQHAGLPCPGARSKLVMWFPSLKHLRVSSSRSVQLKRGTTLAAPAHGYEAPHWPDTDTITMATQTPFSARTQVDRTRPPTHQSTTNCLQGSVGAFLGWLQPFWAGSPFLHSIDTFLFECSKGEHMRLHRAHIPEIQECTTMYQEMPSAGRELRDIRVLGPKQRRSGFELKRSRNAKALRSQPLKTRQKPAAWESRGGWADVWQKAKTTFFSTRTVAPGTHFFC